MPEVADDDMEDEFETDFKKTMMTKNFNCMKFSETKRLLWEPPLKYKSLTNNNMTFVSSEICVCCSAYS